MDSMLEKLVKDYEDTVGVVNPTTTVPKKVNEKLLQYQEAFEENYIAEMMFTSANDKGDLLYTDEDGIHFLLRNEDILGKKYNSWKRSEKLDKKYRVMITDIDDEKDIVYVSAIAAKKFLGDDENDVVRNTDSLIDKSLKRLKENEKLVLPGKVVSVKKTFAIINILGSGVVGRVHVNEWSGAYIRDFRAVCSVGSVYKFQVIGRVERSRQNKNGRMWHLSRVNIESNPWNSDLESIYPKGSILYVKCIECPRMKDGTLKTYWWGKCSEIPGIEIMGDYNVKIDMLPNLMYKCKVDDVNYEKHRFKVVPFEIVDKLENKAPLFAQMKPREQQ